MVHRIKTAHKLSSSLSLLLVCVRACSPPPSLLEYSRCIGRLTISSSCIIIRGGSALRNKSKI